ncbi:MAG: hypothetical protein WC028_06560 [Candidatus Obscuribacterales bacterium]
MTTAIDIEKNKSFVQKLGKSPLIWLLVFLPLLDFGCRVIKPLQFVAIKNFRPIEFDSWVSKFPPYLDSKIRPDVLIVGSSLPMAAFALADKKFAESKSAEDQDGLRTYTEAAVFKKGMLEKLGISARVENFSCAGGMVSDTYIFLKRLIDEGRIPRMVLYGISPRDFVDNMMPPLGQSPLFEVVSDWGFEIPKEGLSTPQYLSCICANYSYYYKTRRKHRNVLTAITADALGRPRDLFTASHNRHNENRLDLPTGEQEKETKETAAPANNPVETDLHWYKKRYNPLNTDRFENETAYLKKLVTLCENHQVILVLIGMPLTEPNKKLMPPQLVSSYVEALAGVQDNNQVKWVDLANTSSFAPQDFSDSAHLNRVGSMKFQKLLLEKMANMAIRPGPQRRESTPKMF